MRSAIGPSFKLHALDGMDGAVLPTIRSPMSAAKARPPHTRTASCTRRDVASVTYPRADQRSQAAARRGPQGPAQPIQVLGCATWRVVVVMSPRRARPPPQTCPPVMHRPRVTGWLQEDLLLGDLWSCVGPILADADAISPFVIQASGAFMLFRNTKCASRRVAAHRGVSLSTSCRA